MASRANAVDGMPPSLETHPVASAEDMPQLNRLVVVSFDPPDVLRLIDPENYVRLSIRNPGQVGHTVLTLPPLAVGTPAAVVLKGAEAGRR